MIVPMTENRSLPLCRNATGKTQVQQCYENQTDSLARIVVADTPFRYGILPQGKLALVTCEGGLCLLPKTIRQYGSCLHLTDIDRWYHFDKHDQLVPVYDPRHLFPEKNTFTQKSDGTLLHYGFPMPPSLVSARENIGIWADGRHWVEAGIEQGLRKQLLNTHRYLTAVCHGQLVITTDRKALSMTAGRAEKLHWSKACKNAMDLCWNELADFTLTTDGQVYFRAAGTRWSRLCSSAAAFSADPDGSDLAVADTEGTVHIFRFHDAGSRCDFSEVTTLPFPGRYISELRISDGRLIVKFTDCEYLIGNYSSADSLSSTADP